MLEPTRAIWEARSHILGFTDGRSRSESYEELVTSVMELPGFNEFRGGDSAAPALGGGQSAPMGGGGQVAPTHPTDEEPF